MQNSYYPSLQEEYNCVGHAQGSEQKEHANELERVLVELEEHGPGEEDGPHQLPLCGVETRPGHHCQHLQANRWKGLVRKRGGKDWCEKEVERTGAKKRWKGLVRKRGGKDWCEKEVERTGAKKRWKGLCEKEVERTVRKRGGKDCAKKRWKGLCEKEVERTVRKRGGKDCAKKRWKGLCEKEVERTGAKQAHNFDSIYQSCYAKLIN